MENPQLTALKANLATAKPRNGQKFQLIEVQQSMQGVPTHIKGTVDVIIAPEVLAEDGVTVETAAVVKTTPCLWNVNGNCMLGLQNSPDYDLVNTTPFADFIKPATV